MRTFGLIGYPLEHALSPDYFKRKFKKEGLSDCTYRLFPMKTLQGYSSFISGFPNLQGLNVTIPHKKAIISLLDQTDPQAARIGAVNCISFSGRNHTSRGYNTDAPAFGNTLARWLGHGKFRAMVLGTGGSSLAVIHSLKNLDISYITVSRTTGKGSLTYARLDEDIMTEHRLIINTTPLGMYPSDRSFPDIPYHFLTSEHYLYDLVYNPRVTAFLSKGKEAGARIKNGLEMFQEQAEISWRIWNDSHESSFSSFRSTTIVK